MHEAFGRTAAWQLWLALLQASSGPMRGIYEDYGASETLKLSRQELEATFRTVWESAQVRMLPVYVAAAIACTAALPAAVT